MKDGEDNRDEFYTARERLLARAHSVIGESIADRMPGATDDAESELHEELLIDAARALVGATWQRKLLFASPYSEPLQQEPK